MPSSRQPRSTFRTGVYDSCPMDGFDFEAVAEIAKLPPDYEIAYMISVGKGTKPAWPKPGQLHLDDVVIEDRLEL
jgi:nitroreductase